MERWEKLKKALDFSGLAEFTSEIQLGKEFAGTDLSGGQWQNWRLLGLLQRKCGTLSFDEANSALDVQSEKQLYRKLMELASGKTVI